MTEKRWPRLLVQNDPYPMRINKELAEEIGFNESIIFLQLEYLIATSTTKEIDGELWTYQSLSDLRKKYFPWWSLATIARILKSLEEKKLIKIGCHNKLGFDRTQWYCFNQEGIAQLKSVQMDTSIFQNEKCKRANCKMDDSKMINASEQIETTIPETPTQTPAEILDSAGKPAASPRSSGKKDSSSKADPRSKHPAILLIKGVTGNFPPKSLYDWIIQELGDCPNGELFAFCNREWDAHGFKPNNLSGKIEWYKQGGPPANLKRAPAPAAAPADYEPTPAQVEAQQIEIAETERLFRLAQERKQQEARP